MARTCDTKLGPRVPRRPVSRPGKIWRWRHFWPSLLWMVPNQWGCWRDKTVHLSNLNLRHYSSMLLTFIFSCTGLLWVQKLRRVFSIHRRLHAQKWSFRWYIGFLSGGICCYNVICELLASFVFPILTNKECCLSGSTFSGCIARNARAGTEKETHLISVYTFSFRY